MNPISVTHKQSGRLRRTSGNAKETCSKCSLKVEDSRKGQRYCKSCHAANMRAKRPKHSELTPEQRMKANCRSYLNTYLKRGYIEKKPCTVCGSDVSQAHHNDYSKPLEVIWFCREHHLEHHNKK